MTLPADTCTECQGFGWLVDDNDRSDWGSEYRCPACNGTGRDSWRTDSPDPVVRALMAMDGHDHLGLDGES